jgi:hypothetical protein
VQQFGQPGSEPAEVAHEAIDPAEVAAIIERIGMIRRKRIENLGLKRALHPMKNGAEHAVGKPHSVNAQHPKPGD